jgi:NhaP-type Na+/H+ or K+/H+ antiporter
MSEASEFTLMGEGSIIIFLLLLVYVVTGSVIEKKKIIFGHETGVAIIIGFIVSWIAFGNDADKLVQLLHFDGNVFFYFILPPIVFSSGYNMHRGKFFENIAYILFFGVLGTFVTYFAFSVLTYLAVSNITMYKSDGLDGESVEFTLSI